MEQAGRITSQHLLDLGLRDLQQHHPEVEFFLFQPEPKDSPLFGHLAFTVVMQDLTLGS